MTITADSGNNEISDLQRLLLSLELMKFTNQTQSGVWGKETQDAVVALYRRLGWDHGDDERFISGAALAAAGGLVAAQVASRVASDVASRAVVGGGGSHVGGGGSHVGGGGSHVGGGGSHVGGGGSHVGGGGTHVGGGGTHVGGGGSHIG